MSFPAFKEWQVIVEALGSGEQVLILRKGGIAEGRGGFQMKEKRFWLFPTSFHAQREKTKEAAHRWFNTYAEQPKPSGVGTDAPTVELRCFSEVVAHTFIESWDTVARLDRFHFWTEDTLRDRFFWGKPPGLHALVVRIHRLVTTRVLGLTAEMAGCKSWVDLPLDFEAEASEPVLGEEAFASRVAEWKEAVDQPSQ